LNSRNAGRRSRRPQTSSSGDCSRPRIYRNKGAPELKFRNLDDHYRFDYQFIYTVVGIVAASLAVVLEGYGDDARRVGLVDRPRRRRPPRLKLVVLSQTPPAVSIEGSRPAHGMDRRINGDATAVAGPELPDAARARHGSADQR